MTVATAPATEPQPTTSANRLAGLWRLMRGFRAPFIAATISLGLAALAKTSAYLLLRRFIDDVLGQADKAALIPVIALGFVVLALFEGSFTFLAGRWAARTSEGTVRNLRNRLFDHIQRLSFTYHDETPTGELIQRATSDVDAIRRFLNDQATAVGRIVMLFSVNFLALLLLNWQLALFSVIVVPFVLVLSIFFFRRINAAYEKYQEQEAVLSTTLQENLTGVRVVKAFARQDYERAKFEKENWEKYQRGRKLLIIHSLYWPMSDILSGLQMLAGFFLAATMAINGTISVGTYVAYHGLVIFVIWPMRNLGRLIVEMSQGLVSYERVATVLKVEEEPLDAGDVHPGTAPNGHIVYDGVSFAYAPAAAAGDGAPEAAASNGQEMAAGAVIEGPVVEGPVVSMQTLSLAQPVPTNGVQNGQGDRANGHEPGVEHGRVLEDIDLEVRPGQVVALMGATGSGKTSLVNLLPRFYEVTGGTITLDGIPLSRYTRRYLRQQIGIVEQEPFLFSRTIRENITYGVGREVPDAEVYAAAAAAAVHDVILSFPEGYSTLVGEKGVTLSGGQKQRVAIARTLLKNPRILILDDATSSVDMETEAEIRQALERLMEGRTTFVIAHRIQSVMAADLILVLKDGRVVQRGTHAQLMAEPGFYRQIYDLQARLEDELQREASPDGPDGRESSDG